MTTVNRPRRLPRFLSIEAIQVTVPAWIEMVMGLPVTDSWQMRVWRQQDTLMYRATIVTLLDELREAAEYIHDDHQYHLSGVLEDCRHDGCARRAGLLRSLSSFSEGEK